MTKFFTFIYLCFFTTALSHAEEEGRSRFLGEQGKVVEKTDWPGEYTKVVAIAYDYTQEDVELVVIDKRLHQGVFYVSPALTEKQTTQLMAAITGKHTPRKAALCFEPHHGFVFYDKDDVIIGSLSICFRCSSYQASPAGELSRRWDLVSLRKLLREVGAPFTDDYTSLFKEYNSK